MFNRFFQTLRGQNGGIEIQAQRGQVQEVLVHQSPSSQQSPTGFPSPEVSRSGLARSNQSRAAGSSRVPTALSYRAVPEVEVAVASNDSTDVETAESGSGDILEYPTTDTRPDIRDSADHRGTVVQPVLTPQVGTKPAPKALPMLPKSSRGYVPGDAPGDEWEGILAKPEPEMTLRCSKAAMAYIYHTFGLGESFMLGEAMALSMRTNVMMRVQRRFSRKSHSEAAEALASLVF